MIIYLETNFILELAFGRAQANACRQLLDWCEEKRLEIRLPAFALTEARSALRRREKERRAFIADLRNHANELLRLHDSADLAASCRAAADAIGTSIDRERAALTVLFERLFQAAFFIPLDHRVVRLTDVFAQFHVLTGDGDLLIYASIMQDLLGRKDTTDVEFSLFVTRDRDFELAARTWLVPFSCDLLNSYDSAVDRVKENIA